MAAPTVTALPTAPARNVADPDTYVDIADAWAAALPTFGAEVQAAGEYANTKAVAANASAQAAALSAAAASGSENTATNKASEAAASAVTAASAAAGWVATSSTSMALTAESKSITVSTGKLFSAGTNIKIKRTSDPLTSYAFTTVSTYNSSTGAMTFTLATGDIAGTGTFSDWTIELSGAKGAAGDMTGSNNLSELTSTSTARSNLGLVIGTDVQAYNAKLAAISGVTGASDKLFYFTGASTGSVTDFTSVARTLVAQSTQSAMLTTGLGLSSAAVTLVQQTSQSNMLTTGLGFSANAVTLVQSANYAAMRTALTLVPGTDVLAYVAPGSSGNILTSNGSAWVSAAPSGGGLVFLQSVSLTGGTTATLNSFSSTYDDYVIELVDVGSGGGIDVAAYIEVQTTGALTSAYAWRRNFRASSNSSDTVTSNSSDSRFRICPALSGASSAPLSGKIEINGARSQTYKTMKATVRQSTTTHIEEYDTVCAQNTASNAITAFILDFSGSPSTGVARLYGKSKA